MSDRQGFALWITGIPSSGKSTITKLLVRKLDELGIRTVALESDVMRTILTPDAAYTPEERDAFYRSLTLIGELLCGNGVNVIFDATANKRAYRDFARSLIPRFAEVHVRCPLDVCMKRDPKGIYGRALSGRASTVPGAQAEYEPPLNPEMAFDGQNPPDRGVDEIVFKLRELKYI